MNDGTRRAAQWLGRRAPFRSGADQLESLQFRYGRPAGLWSRLVARAIALDPTPADSRGRSVEHLIELFFELIETTGIERFVEAGAKDAMASRRAAGLADVEVAVAFEANPFTYRRYEAMVAQCGVRYEPLALVESGGDVVFNVRVDPAGRPRADGQGSLHRQMDQTVSLQEVTVTGTSLDDYFDPADSSRTAFWMDVEGAVADVLRGGVRFLSTVDVVMVEVEKRSKWTGQEWLDTDVIHHLVAAGLRPVARDRQSRHQYNIVFARPEIVARRSPGGDALDRWRSVARR